MRILLLNDDALPTARGGAAVVVDHLRRAYAKQGHDVTLVTTHQDGTGRKEIVDDAGRTISLSLHYDLAQRHRKCTGYPEATQLLTETLDELKPDAVHAHNLHMVLTYDALRIARQHTDRIVLTAHDTFLASFGRVKTDRRLTVFDHLAVAGRRYAPLRNATIRRILRESGARVVAISRILKNFLEHNGIPVHTVIHNGTEIHRVPDAAAIREFRERHQLAGPVILFGGRISGDKGISMLLEAFADVRAHVPGTQLAIAGDRIRAEKYVRSHTNVILLNHLSQGDMRIAYAVADVVTTPSIYLDPFNLINIEAMAAGKPVVGTCFGGAPEIIVNGDTGMIVDPRDTKTFAEALTSILKNPHRARLMGSSGRERVQNNFSLEKQAEAYLKLLS